MTWATQIEVKTQTGMDVTEPTLALASAIISTYTGADEEVPEDAITARDRRLLARATGWQAIWLMSKPGLTTERESNQSTSADGTSIQRGAQSDVMLAPLAAREIKNLSWVGTRTALIPTIQERLGGLNFLSETSDQYGRWSPL